MKISSLSPKEQAVYMQFLKDKAKMQAESIDNIPIDPQGRVLINVSFTAEDLEQIKLSAAIEIDEETWSKLIGQQTTVSLDIKDNEQLKKAFNDKLSAVLQEEDEENFTDILQALEKTPKGSIIALQQEFDFHLRLATRVYQRSVRVLADKGPELELAHQKAMQRVHTEVMKHYAAALKKAFQQDQINLDILNKELDKARETIAPLAHAILCEEILDSTKVTFDAQVLKKPLLKAFAEEMTATPHDLLHTDSELGLATWIEGSEITSHNRGEGEEHLAPRLIITHTYDDSGVVSASTAPRTQIRVPALDAKNSKKSKDWHSEDVQTKIEILAERYKLAEKDANPNKAFVYNLYTSLYHFADDHFTQNMQTKGARQILEGAHRYNEDACILKDPSPLCFVQNIPINGFGDSLGYSKSERPLVKEASLMSEIALLHTLYKTSDPAQKKQIDEVVAQYKKYLSTREKFSFFCTSEAGKNAIRIIQEIKNHWQESPIEEIDPQDVVANAAVCLRNLVAHDLHFDKEYAKLTQSLSVFLEETSIGGCKSANERAQLINSRVSVLDSLLLKTPPLTAEKERISRALQALAHCDSDADHLELAKELKLAIDSALNQTGLQTAMTLISLVDQGAAAKAQVKEGGLESYNSNKFEETTLTHLHQSKSSHMQAHKELVVEMIQASIKVFGSHVASKSEESEDIPERDEVDEEEQERLLAQVGQYSGYKADKEHIKDKDVPNDQFVSDRIAAAAQENLYAGIKEYQKEHLAQIAEYCKAHDLDIPEEDDPNYFRNQFIKYCLSREFNQYIPDEEDLRASSPEQATITLNKFLGEKGAKLYQLALQEERFSKEYMDAAFRASTTHYEGEKWAERPVIIVAGPSASGKSTAAQAAVKNADSHLPKIASKDGNPPGNDVVAADGGVFREVSQMRKLAIRLANREGFTGISDLDAQSSILRKGKKCIQKAVFATPTLGVVIPETFSNPLKVKSMLKKIEGLKHTKTIFTRVDGAEPSVFRRVVGYMGSRRAWKTRDFDKQPSLDLNSTKDLCESKAYKKSGFYWGQKGSILAEEWYKKNSKDKINLLIVNDLILIKPAEQYSVKKSEKWEEAQPDDPGALLVSQRLFDQWLKSDETDLKKFIADNPRPPALIRTTAEQNLIQAVQQLEERLQYEEEHQNRPEKIKLLSSALEIINKIEDMSDAQSLKEAIEGINALRKKDIFLYFAHQTQAVLANVEDALKQQYAAIEPLEVLEENIETLPDDSQITIYHPEGVKIFLAKHNEAKKMEGIVETVLAEEEVLEHVEVQVDQQEDKLFELVGKPNTDEVICFDMTSTRQIHTDPQDDSVVENVQIRGRFTYDTSHSVTTHTNETSKSPGRYELIQFPTTDKRFAKSPKFEEERVKFAMTMAIEILANKKEAPNKSNPIRIRGVSGKEEQVKYLWTALVILGEKNPKMRFSTDAIEVFGRTNFDPKKEKIQSLLGIDKGFAPNSCYVEKFKNYEGLINNYVKEAIKYTEQKESDMAHVDTLTVQKTMKSSVHQIREPDDELEEGEGESIHL